MKSPTSNSRRRFLSKVSASAAAFALPGISGGQTSESRLLPTPSYPDERYAPNDKIRLGTIGFGIQGIGDTAAAVSVPGVEMSGVCDVYQGRLDRAREIYAKDLFVTRDYRELLARKDIDAVIIATPDHWHQTMALDAMKAGKAVYLQKPMIQNISEGAALIEAEKKHKAVIQIGSQVISSIATAKARELYLSGAIGQLNMVEIYNDRFSSEGAWQYPIPPDADPKNIDFDKFLGKAPKVSFDPVRFFRWRNYRDYGTGVAGDLFVHSFTTLHYIIDSTGPERALATGGLRFWKDGREVPDIMMALYDFPEAKSHPAFNAVLRINFVAGNGGGGGYRLIGSEGEMLVGGSRVVLQRNTIDYRPSDYALKAYTTATQAEIVREFEASRADQRPVMSQPEPIVYQAPEDYKGMDYDHFYNFFAAMRGKANIIEDTTCGLRAAGAALLSNLSYESNGIVKWDPSNMRLIS